MTILAQDFSSLDFKNYKKDNFTSLNYTSISYYDFTLEALPDKLQDAKILICEISGIAKNFCGTFIFDLEIGTKYTFKKRDQNKCALLEITKDDKNIFPPYGIGEHPGSNVNVWRVSITKPQSYDAKMDGIVNIKVLDSTNSKETYQCTNPGESTVSFDYRVNN